MFFELNLYSKELKMNTPVNVILPDRVEEGQTYKTLWLLHGLEGDHTSWMRNSSIERYVHKYEIAVVMPSVQRSWYADTAYGMNYFSYITKELPQICRSHFKGMSERREDNIIAGLSMGGYGALKGALRCPKQYGACIALSGALDITRKGRNLYTNEWRALFDFELQDERELEGGENDLFALARKNKQEGLPFPKLYLWCGDQDTLLFNSEQFHALLEELEIPHHFSHSEGDHSWRWWDKQIRPALSYVLEE